MVPVDKRSCAGSRCQTTACVAEMGAVRLRPFQGALTKLADETTCGRRQTARDSGPSANGSIMSLQTDEEWSTILEDSSAIHSGRTAAVFAAIREFHGGVYRTRGGTLVIVASHEAFEKVLKPETVPGRSREVPGTSRSTPYRSTASAWPRRSARSISEWIEGDEVQGSLDGAEQRHQPGHNRPTHSPGRTRKRRHVSARCHQTARTSRSGYRWNRSSTRRSAGWRRNFLGFRTRFWSRAAAVPTTAVPISRCDARSIRWRRRDSFSRRPLLATA